MKYSKALVIASLLTAFASSCSSPSAPVQVPTTADAYFFQQSTVPEYTYSQDNTKKIDTVTYQVSLVDNTFNSYLKLTTKDPSSPNPNVLYYFKNTQAPDGSVICLLANSPTDKGYIALKGTLDLGATWYADSMQNILATVVGKYAEYYLPGRQVHYSDVVVVQYADKTAPANSYIVRYFARNYGLILENTVTGPTSEISDLQLISFQGPVTGANPDTKHNGWYNSNGRYTANMKQDGIVK
jgi:hypothetical protein